MAAPPSINLLREILLITSSIARAIPIIIPLAIIRFLTAAYSLYLYSAINHGWSSPLSNFNRGLSTHYHLLIIFHIIPVVVIIVSPDIITNWL
jgi:NADH:ubiquinone oxidoreductase subunit 4 (subunit M)